MAFKGPHPLRPEERAHTKYDVERGRQPPMADKEATARRRRIELLRELLAERDAERHVYYS